MEDAYTDATGRPNSNNARHNIAPATFGVYTNPLMPGIYTYTTGLALTGDVHFEGTGTGNNKGATDIFIIQIAMTLSQAANCNVILTNGALAKNIFWQVAGQVNLEAGAHMEGIILAKTAAAIKTGSSLSDKVLAQTACTLNQSTIANPLGTWSASDFYVVV